MDSIYKNNCDLLVSNYKNIKEEFRYDGECINHFASLIYADSEGKIPTKKIKSIRTIIKNSTSRMSSFRGDILYMLSFLIAKEDNEKQYISEVIETYDELIEEGFRESASLVLASYAIVKHALPSEKQKTIKNMMEIYKGMEISYKNITNEEDYLECALLALNGLDKDKSVNFMESSFNSVVKLNLFSKNSIQGFIMALLLNENNPEFNSIKELLLEFQKQGIKVCHRTLALLGIAAGDGDAKIYVNKVKEGIDYICSENYEYEYFMDKSFRTFIVVALIEESKKIHKEKFLNELIAMVVYLFITSKKQCVIDQTQTLA